MHSAFKIPGGIARIVSTLPRLKTGLSIRTCSIKAIEFSPFVPAAKSLFTLIPALDRLVPAHVVQDPMPLPLKRLFGIDGKHEHPDFSEILLESPNWGKLRSATVQ